MYSDVSDVQAGDVFFQVLLGCSFRAMAQEKERTRGKQTPLHEQNCCYRQSITQKA